MIEVMSVVGRYQPEEFAEAIRDLDNGKTLTAFWRDFAPWMEKVIAHLDDPQQRIRAVR